MGDGGEMRGRRWEMTLMEATSEQLMRPSFMHRIEAARAGCSCCHPESKQRSHTNKLTWRGRGRG